MGDGLGMLDEYLFDDRLNLIFFLPVVPRRLAYDLSHACIWHGTIRATMLQRGAAANEALLVVYVV